MDSLYLKSLILGIIEGLTEFLPISSTGHLILASDLLDFTGDKAKLFAIVIQVGAILAICWEYRHKLISVIANASTSKASRKFLLNIATAFIPFALLGFLFGSKIKAVLFNPISVATAFIVGGFIIIWAENREHTVRINEVDELSTLDALKLGLAQTFALIPGTSRSGATIVGGLFFGLSRKAATEFSFFLAIPTLVMASAYDLYKHRDLLILENDGIDFAIGLVAAFISALLAVKGLLRYISHHNFIIFAWYRIIFGTAVLATSYGNLVHWHPN